jgi:hypothetical protein
MSNRMRHSGFAAAAARKKAPRGQLINTMGFFVEYLARAI